MNNLFDALVGHHVGSGHGAAVALSVDGGAQWTYEDLAAASARMAGALREAGVATGDRVVVQAGKSAQALSLYLGLVRMGATYVPLNTDYTPAEVARFLADADPMLFVAGQAAIDATLPLMPPYRVRAASLESDGTGTMTAQSMGAVPYSDVHDVAEDDIAAILFTSGTTGRSKGAMLTHRNLAFMAQALCGQWDIRSSDVLLHVLPLFHAHGLFIATNPTLHAGARIVLLPKFTVAAVLARLAESTVFMGVPTFYTRLLADEAFTREACAGIRLFTSGSAPLSSETFLEFERKTGHTILERYGLTETTVVSSNPLRGERVPGTVGYPLNGVEVRLAGAESHLSAPEVGELEVRGPNVFKGYWRMPQNTAEVMHPDGFFKTGDIARIGPDGRITLVGRSKDLIITGGYNVYPREVEEVLCSTPGIRDAAVIGIPHPDFGEGVVAVAERDASVSCPTEAEVLTAASQVLAKYKVPKRLFYVDALPRNAMGKVVKSELRESFASAFSVA
jgi:malonyl-CoA/methylmalonyl-CoA synthetase